MADRREIIGALSDTVENVVRRLQLRAWQALTSGTPVDTGFARAGWFPAVGSPSVGPADRPVNFDAAEAIARAIFAGNAKRAEEIARTYKLRDGAVYIATAVRYMQFLNAGTSAQAPALFVEKAVAAAVAATRAEL